MRAAEEPLKSDLDVAGLKAQVLLSELVPAMESRGYDTESVKAAIGG
jgi:hypothetical protein